ARAKQLDWERLLRRFGAHWRGVFSYLFFFGFIFPSPRADIPQWLLDALPPKFREKRAAPPPRALLCPGALRSREQFLIDIQQWGYLDARLLPEGNMTRAETELWTAAIQQKK